MKKIILIGLCIWVSTFLSAHQLTSPDGHFQLDVAVNGGAPITNSLIKVKRSSKPADWDSKPNRHLCLPDSL